MFIEATRLQVQGRVVLYKVEATRVIIKLILFLDALGPVITNQYFLEGFISPKIFI